MINLYNLKKYKNIKLIDNKLKMNFFLYEIVHHCNLNCKGCDHCAPLAEKEFVSINTYKKDLIQLSKVFDEIRIIGIMGGEPLLHPQINDFIKATREIFPNICIMIFTNGTLLLSKDSSFWETLRETNTMINATFYHDDKKEILCNKCKEENVRIVTARKLEKNKLPFKKINFDLKGRQNKHISHLLCSIATTCVSLEDGKLYKCTVMCGARHFNKYFDKILIVQEKDYIDIYNPPTKKEIFDYMYNANPFCRYCNSLKQNKYYWELSKKDIKEWT